MSIVEATLEHYKASLPKIRSAFTDYYFSCSLQGEDGKDYFVTLVIVGHTVMGEYDSGRISISVEPLRYFTTPSSRTIINGEKAEIENRLLLPVGSIKTEASSTDLTITLDAFQITIAPPAYEFRYHGEDASVDLRFKSLGTPFWFNQGKPEGARITPSTIVKGLEAFGEVEGTITLDGKEVAVKGVGCHEHVQSDAIHWMEFGWQDWMWFVFDELYGLAFNMQGGEYKDGGIYLRNEKEYLVVKDFFIDRPKWAFSPTLQHQWPITFTLEAPTDKGTLFLEGDVVRSQPYYQVEKHRQAMTMPFADMDVNWRGTFVYKDGKKMNLTNGKGGNEVIAAYNFAQGPH
jgi:hypothetical protein